MTHRFGVVLFVTFAALTLPGRGAAASEPTRACRGVEAAVTTPEQDLAFGRALVESVRLDLRTSEKLSARLIACLDGDGAWFTDRGLPWDPRTRDECDARVTALEKIIAKNLPRVRQDLALMDVALEGDGYDVSYVDPVAPAEIERWLRDAPFTFDHFLIREVAHPYRGLADLEPLTKDEIRAAMATLATVAAEFRAAGPGAGRDFFARRRAGFRKDYGALLAANPVLGFLRSLTPTRTDLRAALVHLVAHARRALARHEDTFYVKGVVEPNALTPGNLADLSLYRPALERVTDADPRSCPRANELIARATRRGLWQTLGIAGLSLAAVVGCQILKARVPTLRALRFCAPGVGLTTNAFGVGVADQSYAAALEGVLQSPYGWYALNELDQLDDRQFEYVLAWALSPIGSGLPLHRWLSPGLVTRLLR